MAQRRSLKQGLKDIEVADRELEEQFVYRKQKRPSAKPPRTAPEPMRPAEHVTPAQPQATAPVTEQPAASPFIGESRVPVGARVRPDLATALKRASLERQLKGIQPCSIQDILEDALALWLLKNGHTR